MSPVTRKIVDDVANPTRRGMLQGLGGLLSKGKSVPPVRMIGNAVIATVGGVETQIVPAVRGGSFIDQWAAVAGGCIEGFTSKNMDVDPYINAIALEISHSKNQLLTLSKLASLTSAERLAVFASPEFSKYAAPMNWAGEYNANDPGDPRREYDFRRYNIEPVRLITDEGLEAELLRVFQNFRDTLSGMIEKAPVQTGIIEHWSSAARMTLASLRAEPYSDVFKFFKDVDLSPLEQAKIYAQSLNWAAPANVFNLPDDKFVRWFKGTGAYDAIFKDAVAHLDYSQYIDEYGQEIGMRHYTGMVEKIGRVLGMSVDEARKAARKKTDTRKAAPYYQVTQRDQSVSADVNVYDVSAGSKLDLKRDPFAMVKAAMAMTDGKDLDGSNCGLKWLSDKSFRLMLPKGTLADWEMKDAVSNCYHWQADYFENKGFVLEPDFDRGARLSSHERRVQEHYHL